MVPTRREFTAGLCGAALIPARLSASPRKLAAPDPMLWDPPAGPLVEGEAVGPNGAVYYRRHGVEGRTPVVILHGGPAGGHRYMRPYAALATDRQVVLYDQSGCGRSAQPADLARYSVDAYVAELEALRAHLDFDDMILIGHSWGGMLAPAYAAAHPGRVRAMVLAGSAPRWRDFADAADRWLAEFGPKAVATVAAARAGQVDAAAYGALLQAYYARHLCRLDPWPAWFEAEGEAIDRNPVYKYLNGPSEFQFTGALAGIDLRATLGTLAMPVLVTCGEYDEAPPRVARSYLRLMPHARLQAFDGLSHMAHIEDPARVIGATARFVRTIA